jgi:methylthioribose-1-phosphate isomerase
MKTFESLALRSDGTRLWALDQTLLPDLEIWVDASDPTVMTDLIQRLCVRGAPLIGVAAAMSLACLAESRAGDREIRTAAMQLRSARPTAVNLAAAIDRVMVAAGDPIDRDALVEMAELLYAEDVELCERLAQHGSRLISDGEGVLTHCNSGGLATVGIGTALGVIRRAHEAGRRIHVFVDETRPLLQGARLTAWELDRLEIPYTLITDGMGPILMRAGRIQRVFVGADRIARNGDVANKVGTYAVAVAARAHDVPFYPVAPWTTVDLACASGDAVPIEERDADEVRGARGSFGRVRWSPAAAQVFNPAFDVTPAALVTALVLDRGVVTRDQLMKCALLDLAAGPV